MIKVAFGWSEANRKILYALNFLKLGVVLTMRYQIEAKPKYIPILNLFFLNGSYRSKRNCYSLYGK
jgi:hypothetical protein